MVAKFLDPNNFSQQRWPFVLANNGRKVKAIVHKKVMHVDSLVFPAILILQDQSLLRSRDFDTMAM